MSLYVPQSYLPLVYLGVGGTVLDMVNGKGHAMHRSLLHSTYCSV